MASMLPRRVPYVCKACRSAQASKAIRRAFSTTVERPVTLRDQLQAREKGHPSRENVPTPKRLGKLRDPLRQGPEQGRAPKERRTLEDIEVAEEEQPSKLKPPTREQAQPYPETNKGLTLRAIQRAVLDVLDADTVPTEEHIQAIMGAAVEQATWRAHHPIERRSPGKIEKSIPAESLEAPENSLLVDLDEPQRETSQTQKIASPASGAASTASPPTPNELSALFADTVKALYTLLEDPKVFISESILSSYITLLTLVNMPEYAPKIFYLYAHKPIPQPNTHPIRYSEPYSRAPKYAIPLKIVDMAMTSAIAKRDMPLCISIIDTTVATPQFQAAKFVKSALLPLGATAGLVPISWGLSQKAADWQLSWDPDTFFWMCMAGGGAYLGTMGTLLFITVTTWNDHHKRVRWVPGTPLGRRWFREEERSYFDRMAMAWGYQDPNRHGEETGEEWEAFREVLGLRYLDLDRSSLLPGML